MIITLGLKVCGSACPPGNLWSRWVFGGPPKQAAAEVAKGRRRAGCAGKPGLVVVILAGEPDRFAISR